MRCCRSSFVRWLQRLRRQCVGRLKGKAPEYAVRSRGSLLYTQDVPRWNSSGHGQLGQHFTGTSSLRPGNIRILYVFTAKQKREN